MDKTNTWLISVFAFVLVCFSLFAYLNSQANQSLLRPIIEDFDYKAFLLRPKPSIEDLEYKTLDKKRQMLNMQRIDLLTMKNLEVFFFVILHSIVGLKQQPIRTNGIIYFWERSRFIKMGYCYQRLCKRKIKM